MQKRRDCDHLKSRGAPKFPEQRDEHDAVLWPIPTKNECRPVTGPEMYVILPFGLDCLRKKLPMDLRPERGTISP
jgi:hypothetical protein